MKTAAVVLVAVLVGGVGAWAQEAGATAGTPLQATPQDGYAAARSLELYREGNARMLMNDYGQLARYHDDDVKLGPPAPGEQRVVFFGDSITDIWKLDESFPGKHYINRGIGGQTTPQMLVRFRADVIALQPAVVVVLAGTNDIAGNTGDETLEQIEGDYATMAELAKAHGIRIVFSSVTPINDYNPRALLFFLQRSTEKILTLNEWLTQYCGEKGLVYLNYFPALVDEHGMMKVNLSDDGLHPNAAGFAVMAPLAEAAIGQAER
jgi:lysophospholipase L1-like esterase